MKEVSSNRIKQCTFMNMVMQIGYDLLTEENLTQVNWSVKACAPRRCAWLKYTYNCFTFYRMFLVVKHIY